MTIYWLEQSAAEVPEENDWLSESETLSLKKMRIAKRRSDWRLGRWTAKRALSIYLDVPAHPEAFRRIEIRPASSGAPEIFFDNQPAGATISLGHRDGIGVCAVGISGVEIGCDLEIVEPRSDAFLADYFTHEEQAMVVRASAADRNRLLALLWSAKESALKALHTGLRLDTRCVVVNPFAHSFGLHGWSRLLVRYTGGQKDALFHGWWQLAGNIVRTVVAAPPPDSPILLTVPTRRLENLSCRYA